MIYVYDNLIYLVARNLYVSR